MTTQHFCLFLKKRNNRRASQRVRREGICRFCDAKISRYHGGTVCWPCEEKIKSQHEEENMYEAFDELEWQPRENVLFASPSRKPRTLVTLYRVCKGVCRGNAETIFAEADPNAKIIILPRTRALGEDERCGQCGGPVTFFRDLVPDWARNFEVRITRAPISFQGKHPSFSQGIRIT